MPANSSAREMSRAVSLAVTQWTPGIKPRWTISEVRHALRLHSTGDFSLSSLLVDAMGEDDSIPGLLEKLVDSVLGKEFCLNPVDKPNRQLSKRIATELEPIWWDMYPEPELDEFVRWYKMLGVGLAVLDWDRSPDRWSPRLRTLHPQFLWRDQANQKWWYTAREGMLEVTPGDGRWVMLIDGQRGWMRGLVRPTAIPWIGKQLTIRDQGRYNERHGFPIVLARVPAIADDGDKDDFWEDLQDIQQETVAALPTHVDGESADAKFDLDLLEATDQSSKTFGDTLDRWDRRLTILFLGGNQSTEVTDKGTHASASSHADQLSDRGTSIEKKLSTQIRRQCVYPTCAFNYAGATLDVVPWPHWNTEPPEDTLLEAQDQKAFGDAVDAVQKAGYEIDNLDELAEKHGLKLTKKEPPAPAVVPKPAVPSPDDPVIPGTEPIAARGGLVRILASGASTSENRGFIEGQLYVDAVVEGVSALADAALKPTLDAILEELDAATDYEDLAKRLRARYVTMSPADLSELVYRAMIVGGLAGNRAVTQDA